MFEEFGVQISGIRSKDALLDTQILWLGTR
jgi:hypothetical protein